MTVPYPNLDPVALHLGPLPIRWYSLGYIFGIGLGWWYALSLIKKKPLWPAAGAPVSKVQLDDVIFWVAIGVMAGGRLGYVLFYEPSLLTGAWEPLGATMPDGIIKSAIGWLPIPRCSNASSSCSAPNASFPRSATATSTNSSRLPNPSGAS